MCLRSRLREQRRARRQQFEQRYGDGAGARDQWVVLRRLKGETVNVIAYATGLSPHTVRHILRRHGWHLHGDNPRSWRYFMTDGGAEALGLHADTIAKTGAQRVRRGWFGRDPSEVYRVTQKAPRPVIPIGTAGFCDDCGRPWQRHCGCGD